MLRIILAILAFVALLTPAAAQITSIPLPSDTVSIPTVDASSASGPASASSAPDVETAPAPCGGETITIAQMQWPTAQLLAAIHARLIKQNFGCDVEIVAGEPAGTASSMGNSGQPAVAPELWISRVADVWNGALKSQQVRQGGATYVEPLFEGWFVPDYEAAAHPELKTVADLKTRWKDFAPPGGKKGKFISCPPDWACAVINRNLFKANKLDQFYDIEEPANRFELDTLISEAESRKQPILFYYWQPNAVMAQFSFKAIDLGTFNKDNFACLGRTACENPQPSSFSPDPVIVAVAQWVYLDAPEVAAYLQRAHMPFAEMNTLLQNLNQPGATVDSVADAFVAARGEVWQSWVGKRTTAAQ